MPVIGYRPTRTAAVHRTRRLSSRLPVLIFWWPPLGLYVVSRLWAKRSQWRRLR